MSDPVQPISTIKPQVMFVTPLDGYPDVLVDDPNYLVDDPRALVGSPVTAVPMMRTGTDSNAPNTTIQKRR